jgi:hypothetical protein
MQLCRTDWDAAQLVRYSDVLLLRDGVHTCDHGLVMPRGVTVRGESTQGTIVRGTSDLYLVNVGPAGTTVFDSQTIDRSGATSDEIASIRMGRGRLAVTDVDIIGDPGTGIWMNVGGSGSVNRFRYLQGQSSSAALAVFEGSLTARAITVDTAGTGIWLFSGALELTDSSLTTEHFALIAGRSFFHGGSRDLRVERTTFQCQQTCIQTYEASLTMVDSAIQANPNASSQFGLQMGGGMLELDRSVVHGWTSRAVSLAFGDGPVNARLDGVDIDTGGLEFDGGGVPPFHGRLTMRRSHVHGADGIAALVVFDYSGADLGTGDDPGDNRLDSSPGAPALVYNGNGPDFSIDVHGTTLNGTSYKDDVVGPASTVDYAIGAITMHF